MYLTGYDTCKHCKGTGVVDSILGMHRATCEYCMGLGMVPEASKPAAQPGIDEGLREDLPKRLRDW